MRAVMAINFESLLPGVVPEQKIKRAEDAKGIRDDSVQGSGKQRRKYVSQISRFWCLISTVFIDETSEAKPASFDMDTMKMEDGCLDLSSKKGQSHTI